MTNTDILFKSLLSLPWHQIYWVTLVELELDSDDVTLFFGNFFDQL